MLCPLVQWAMQGYNVTFFAKRIYINTFNSIDSCAFIHKNFNAKALCYAGDSRAYSAISDNAPGTNGIVHARKLVQNGFNAFIIGGSLRPMTEAAVGSAAIESIKQYNFTKCFMGANGVDIERGFTTPDISEAAIKAEAIRRSHVSYVLVDHEKFGRVSSVTFAGIEDASIITNRAENPQYRQYTAIKEVDLEYGGRK